LSDSQAAVSLFCDDMRFCGVVLDNPEEMDYGGSAGECDEENRMNYYLVKRLNG